MNKFLLFGLLILLSFKSTCLKAETFLVSDSIKVKIVEIDTALLQPFNSKLLHAFYKSNGNKTAWMHVDATRKFLLATLKSCAEDGLDPKEYDLKKLQDYETEFELLSDRELIDYDILLTLKLQKYVSQISNGRFNPKVLYRNWDLKENKIDINSQLASFEKSDSLSLKIERLKPNHLQYKSLKKALQLLNSYPDETIECIEYTAMLGKYSCSPSLLPIKKKLIYWKDLEPTAILDSSYNDVTFAAIKKFQKRHGLVADGVIGRKTVEALNFSKNRRREQIIVNLERWKWFPRNLGNHYIVVNIPEYNLKIVKNNDTIEVKNVVVGQIARQSVVLSSTFNNIILNPTWTVPPTILEQDLLPAATKRSSYFTTRNITIYDLYENVVSPSDWNPEKYKTYRYVQSPGDGNSLGYVKFNFPNHYSVYLHDTNHRDLFSRNIRSLSSGCIRVENPLPLAQYMLNDPKRWSMEKICDVIATRKTTVLPLREKINIHQLYCTAWSDTKGILEFRADIYNLDDELYEKLGN
jgi:murein L,D-transpeptidase YcbB/YkuD